MSTDDEIRDAFHSAFAPAVGEVSINPTMLAGVRRRHARQQRMLTVGAPLGVAVVTAGAIVGGVAIHDGSGRTGHIQPAVGGNSNAPAPKNNQVVNTTQTVTLVGHNLSLPSDWTLSGNRRLIDLNHPSNPDPAGGQDQSVKATSPDGSESFSASVYHGPISNAEASTNDTTNDPAWTHFTVNGNVASTLISGPPTTCYKLGPSDGASGRNQVKHSGKRAHSLNATHSEVPCDPATYPADAKYGEARYSFDNGDFMMVDSTGLDSDALQAFLTTALS